LSPAKPVGGAHLDLLSDIFSTTSVSSAPAAAPVMSATFDPFAPQPHQQQQPVLQPFNNSNSNGMMMMNNTGYPGMMMNNNNNNTSAFPQAQPANNMMMGFPPVTAAAAQSISPSPSPFAPVNPPTQLSMGSTAAMTTASGPAPIVAHDKDGFKVLIEMWKPAPSTPANTQLLCKYSNSTSSPITDFIFQAAVPKYLKLEMSPPTSATIPPNTNGSVTQELKVCNSVQGEKPIMLKLKILYKLNGQPVRCLVV